MEYCTMHTLQEIVPYDACNGKLYISPKALFYEVLLIITLC